MNRIITALLLVSVLSYLPAANGVTIDTVPVGNEGNANDPRDGDHWTAEAPHFGGVGYAYRIGVTEVTVGQYTEFLNAVAATDTHALYNTAMATDLNVAGISQSGVSGSYSYSVIGSPDHPVSYVSWGDAARFCNWLQNGQPGLGSLAVPQDAASTEDGAYTLNGATSNDALNAVTRNLGAQWFIPSQNEWYKAAYHKNDGATANYWSYPTATDDFINSDDPPGFLLIETNVANYFYDDELPNTYNGGYAVTGRIHRDGSQNYLTDVGAYPSATSPYGTFDQGGNVREWTEDSYTYYTGRTVRTAHGGAWDDYFYELLFSSPYKTDPTHELSIVGFRVATRLPEPGIGVVPIIAVGMVWWDARRRRGGTTTSAAPRSGPDPIIRLTNDLCFVAQKTRRPAPFRLEGERIEKGPS